MVSDYSVGIIVLFIVVFMFSLNSKIQRLPRRSDRVTTSPPTIPGPQGGTIDE